MTSEGRIRGFYLGYFVYHRIDWRLRQDTNKFTSCTAGDSSAHGQMHNNRIYWLMHCWSLCLWWMQVSRKAPLKELLTGKQSTSYIYQATAALGIIQKSRTICCNIIVFTGKQANMHRCVFLLRVLLLLDSKSAWYFDCFDSPYFMAFFSVVQSMLLLTTEDVTLGLPMGGIALCLFNEILLFGVKIHCSALNVTYFPLLFSFYLLCTFSITCQFNN